MAKTPDDVYAEVMRRMFPDTTTATLDDMRAAIDIAYTAGLAAPSEGSKTQWGIRRVGFKSVRICTEQKARSLLRNWIPAGEVVARHISPWEVS